MTHDVRYRTILVPLDGSPFGEQALPFAAGAALRTGAVLQLVHVHRSDTVETITPDPRWDEAFRRQQEEYLAAVAREVSRRHGVEARTEVVTGTPVYTLVQWTEKPGADLVVMTTHGRSGISRLWLGSVADGMVRGAKIPVLLIRPDEDDSPDRPAAEFREVLVPLDGSRLSEQVLERVLALTGVQDVRYTLLHIVAPALRLDGKGLHVDEAREAELEARAAEQLAATARRLHERGPEVRYEVVAHPVPPQYIVEYAEEHSIELIAMTTHGRGGLSRLILGSVADKVLRASPVPLLLYRPEDGGT